MSSGFDDFLLPGKSSEKPTLYLVSCPNGDYRYISLEWVRGRCPNDGSPLKVVEVDRPLEQLPEPTEEDAINEALKSLPEPYLVPARKVLIALKSGGQ